MATENVKSLVKSRFWDKVNKSGDCWEWKASKDTTGYGHFRVGLKIVPAHRVSYEILVGKIPRGLTLDHLCKNRACVNPKHLEPVTLKENILRGDSPSAKAARVTHCPRGHAYNDSNTYRDPTTGGRFCKACRPWYKKRWLDKKNSRP